MQEIAAFHNLAAIIEQTQEQHAQIEQNQESDFEFVKKLAERNHYEVYVDERRTLHFALYFIDEARWEGIDHTVTLPGTISRATS